LDKNNRTNFEIQGKFSQALSQQVIAKGKTCLISFEKMSIYILLILQKNAKNTS